MCYLEQLLVFDIWMIKNMLLMILIISVDNPFLMLRFGSCSEFIEVMAAGELIVLFYS